ncbi:MAG: anthranilate/aminodeoxychorismate synthase component II, partial [Thioalkalivibrio sp.]|nr:anthranilate/aminodeoxychorismate synthase component II [Thioalkalivibrio sp.]
AGEIQAMRHRELPIWGVQFHPESLFSEHGSALLANFLTL